MRKVFQAELQQVGEELIHIANLVEEARQRSARAFLTADIQEAEDVISNDARIALLQNELDEKSIDLLALQSPVASDLRMSSSLERMGDLALADQISVHKARINELHREVFARITAPDWGQDPQTTVDVPLASRYLERFADHGVSVSRKVTYLVTGDWNTNQP